MIRIYRNGDAYNAWSTISNCPVYTEAMTREELIGAEIQRRTAKATEEIRRNIEHDMRSAEYRYWPLEFPKYNQAGDNCESLTTDEIVKRFFTLKGDEI